MPTIYPSLSIPATRRLAMFRAEATAHNAKPYITEKTATWRNVRYATLKSHTGLGQGFNTDGRGKKTPIWSAMDDGPAFRNERDAGDIQQGMRHSGWYTDADASELAIGIVASLPHGRFIAGYRLTMNDERVYYPEIFDDEREAARRADGHAESIADAEREYSEKYQAARQIEDDIEQSQMRLRELLALRHRTCDCFSYVRDEIAETIESIRAGRLQLTNEFKDVL